VGSTRIIQGLRSSSCSVRSTSLQAQDPSGVHALVAGVDPCRPHLSSSPPAFANEVALAAPAFGAAAPNPIAAFTGAIPARKILMTTMALPVGNNYVLPAAEPGSRPPPWTKKGWHEPSSIGVHTQRNAQRSDAGWGPREIDCTAG